MLNSTLCGATSQTQTATITTTVGATLPVGGELTLVAVNFANDPNFAGAVAGSYQAVTDASHTAMFFLDPLTPGVSYTSGNDVTYFSPTPEPSAALLMGTAIIPLLALLRGKVRRGR